MGKTWSEIVTGHDGLLREREVYSPGSDAEPKAPSTPVLKVPGVLGHGRAGLVADVLGVVVVLLAVLSIALAAQLRHQAGDIASLTQRVEAAEADARDALVTATAPMTAYERCATDLGTAWVLFQGGVADINPPSCTPPLVTREEYRRAFEAVGGPRWVGVPDGQAAPMSPPVDP